MFLSAHTQWEGKSHSQHSITQQRARTGDIIVWLCSVQFPPLSIASEQQAGATGSVSWVHQIAAMAVSSSVYLSKLCGCHPASQAAIARPPPLPYQDNELHLGPL